MSDNDQILADWLLYRQQQRERRVDAMLGALTDRERALVREAAVIGYVTGAAYGPHTERFPRDNVIVAHVLAECDRHSDLYPTIAALATNEAAGGDG